MRITLLATVISAALLGGCATYEGPGYGYTSYGSYGYYDNGPYAYDYGYYTPGYYYEPGFYGSFSYYGSNHDGYHHYGYSTNRGSWQQGSFQPRIHQSNSSHRSGANVPQHRDRAGSQTAQRERANQRATAARDSRGNRESRHLAAAGRGENERERERGG